MLTLVGGLSTSLKSLKANILLSLGVAITGISLPIALSFILRHLMDATPIQCFAAGAALCSTSLGTTFTVLGTSGLIKSRLGVILTSAAMMDDVIGLVLVQVISNLGQTSTSNISTVTIVRPLFVSLAFAVFAPLVCVFVVKPATLWLNAQRANQPAGYLNRALMAHGAAFALHTLILLGCIAAATYAGTSNLFAAYIAGASISWWDSEVPHSAKDGTPQAATTTATNANEVGTATPEADEGNTVTLSLSSQNKPAPGFSGLEVYEKYYLAPVNRVLKPFFFVC